MAAAAIHAAVTPHHFGEWAGSGLFLLSLAIFQAVLAASLLQPRSSTPRFAAIVLSGAVIFIWLLSRTAGLPIGPHAGIPEAATGADTAATILESITIAILLPSPGSTLRMTAAAAGAGMLLSAALVTGVAVGSPGISAMHDNRRHCESGHAPRSYLDHSAHRDPLAFLDEESPGVAGTHCHP